MFEYNDGITLSAATCTVDPEAGRMAECGSVPMAAGTTQATLPGTHVTPCGGDIGLQWQPGQSVSLTDVVALGVRTFAQADVRRLADRLIDWLNVQSAGVSTAGPRGDDNLRDRF